MGNELTMLYLDDLRLSPGDNWDVVRSYDEFVAFIRINGVPDHISFDHDLGEGKSGMDCAKWLVENNYQVKQFYVHSANPVGKKNIECLLNNWKKHCEK